jgi:hypothetical protein
MSFLTSTEHASRKGSPGTEACTEGVQGGVSGRCSCP